MCVGGARGSHLRGMRCYIPDGMPQRELMGRKDQWQWGVVCQKRQGQRLNNQICARHSATYVISAQSSSLLERWTTTTSAASPFPASTTCPNYEPCKSHIFHFLPRPRVLQNERVLPVRQAFWSPIWSQGAWMSFQAVFGRQPSDLHRSICNIARGHYPLHLKRTHH